MNSSYNALVDDAPIVASARNLTKSYGNFTAVDGIDFDIRANKIYGLLGRNGAGKTTVMQMLTAQDHQTSGTIEVMGEAPYENAHVLRNVCFVKESQKYPDDFKVEHVLGCAAALLPFWDESIAQNLLKDFDLPVGRKVKKLSRGMTSSLGIVIGLAARAPLTIFDEPYLGLDAVARHVFYDRLLADYAEHPRTVVLSTHLIDEVSDLIEHVILIDKGRIVLDEDADSLRDSAFVVSGASDAVAGFCAGRTILHRDRLGSMARVTVEARLSAEEKARAAAVGLDVEPLSLQQLVIRTTDTGVDTSDTAEKESTV